MTIQEDFTDIRFAVSCSSNMNRSMEAHLMLMQRGFNVESYGSGNQVKLPGKSADTPNCYEFETTTYEFIYNDLLQKDKAYYTSNGLLNMIDRNRRIKEAPQKFQLTKKEFDVIICLEERVYDQVVEHLHSRPERNGNPVHVINIDIVDNAEEATVGAFTVLDLCSKLKNCDDLDAQIDDALAEFESHPSRKVNNLLHTICFY